MSEKGKARCVVFLHFERRDGQKWESGSLERNLTLISLRGDKVLDEGVRRLRVERECVLQRLEVLRLVDVAHLESDAARVEVLLDGLQGRLQHGALLRAQTSALRGRVDFVLEERGEDVPLCSLTAERHWSR